MKNLNVQAQQIYLFHMFKTFFIKCKKYIYLNNQLINHHIMINKLKNIAKTGIFAFLLVFAKSTMAQDGTIYPLAAPPEPNAIPLGTGGVDNQPATESWFRQWGDPMARNITKATLTPFLPEPGKGNGAAVIVAPGGGFMWLSMGNEGWEVAEALAKQGIAAFVLKYRPATFPPPRKGGRR
jgi:hypothetical protein